MNKRPPRSGEKVEKIQNTLLIDGNAVFKFGYFGAKNQYNTRGEHVGGVLSFLTIVRMLLNQDLYHKVCIFWDGNLSGKLRYEIYDQYKIGRGKNFKEGTYPVDEDELKQRARVWYYINEMYIRQLKHEIVETDDFIAYYCLNKMANEKITICSLDRDFCQLISEDIRIYFLDLKVYVDLTNFSSYFRYYQGNSLLIKTIAGDDSDSIKGIKGVKEKTLLTLFPDLTKKTVTLTELITNAKQLQEDRIRKKEKPLKALTNIINSITDGVQGTNIYEINNKLVDLKNPMLTEDAIVDFNNLIDGDFTVSDKDDKIIFEMMSHDELDKIMGPTRYQDYLLPFKKLKGRE